MRLAGKARTGPPWHGVCRLSMLSKLEETISLLPATPGPWCASRATRTVWCRSAWRGCSTASRRLGPRLNFASDCPCRGRAGRGTGCATTRRCGNARGVCGWRSGFRMAEDGRTVSCEPSRPGRAECRAAASGVGSKRWPWGGSADPELCVVLASSPLHDRPEQGADTRGHRHGQCAPERHAQGARRHPRAAGARRQCPQQRDKQQ